MKIDSHHHLWDLAKYPYDWMVGEEMKPIRRNFEVRDLQSAIAGTGIEKTVLVHATTTHDETYDMLELADSNSTIIAVVGWLDIHSLESIAECEKYLQAKGGSYLKGIRDVAQDHPDSHYLARPQAIATVRKLGELGLVFEILTKTPELKGAIDLVRACPNVQFVLDHISKPYISRQEFEPWKSMITELSKFANVSCKISGLVTEAKWKQWKVEDYVPYIDHVIESFTPARLMFGSDWPVALLGADNYSQVVKLASMLTQEFSDSEKDGFWSENVLKYYKITNM
jgi:L-fuconolactonase